MRHRKHSSSQHSNQHADESRLNRALQRSGLRTLNDLKNKENETLFMEIIDSLRKHHKGEYFKKHFPLSEVLPASWVDDLSRWPGLANFPRTVTYSTAASLLMTLGAVLYYRLGGVSATEKASVKKEPTVADQDLQNQEFLFESQLTMAFVILFAMLLVTGYHLWQDTRNLDTEPLISLRDMTIWLKEQPLFDKELPQNNRETVVSALAVLNEKLKAIMHKRMYRAKEKESWTRSKDYSRAMTSIILAIRQYLVESDLLTCDESEIKKEQIPELITSAAAETEVESAVAQSNSIPSLSSLTKPEEAILKKPATSKIQLALLDKIANIENLFLRLPNPKTKAEAAESDVKTEGEAVEQVTEDTSLLKKIARLEKNFTTILATYPKAKLSVTITPKGSPDKRANNLETGLQELLRFLGRSQTPPLEQTSPSSATAEEQLTETNHSTAPVVEEKPTSEQSEAIDPADFPLQLVRHLRDLSKGHDLSPSNSSGALENLLNDPFIQREKTEQVMLLTAYLGGAWLKERDSHGALTEIGLAEQDRDARTIAALAPVDVSKSLAKGALASNPRGIKQQIILFKKLLSSPLDAPREVAAALFWHKAFEAWRVPLLNACLLQRFQSTHGDITIDFLGPLFENHIGHVIHLFNESPHLASKLLRVMAQDLCRLTESHSSDAGLVLYNKGMLSGPIIDQTPETQSSTDDHRYRIEKSGRLLRQLLWHVGLGRPAISAIRHELMTQAESDGFYQVLFSITTEDELAERYVGLIQNYQKNSLALSIFHDFFSNKPEMAFELIVLFSLYGKRLDDTKNFYPPFIEFVIALCRDTHHPAAMRENLTKAFCALTNKVGKIDALKPIIEDGLYYTAGALIVESASSTLPSSALNSAFSGVCTPLDEQYGEHRSDSVFQLIVSNEFIGKSEAFKTLSRLFQGLSANDATRHHQLMMDKQNITPLNGLAFIDARSLAHETRLVLNTLERLCNAESSDNALNIPQVISQLSAQLSISKTDQINLTIRILNNLEQARHESSRFFNRREILAEEVIITSSLQGLTRTDLKEYIQHPDFLELLKILHKRELLLNDQGENGPPPSRTSLTAALLYAHYQEHRNHNTNVANYIRALNSAGVYYFDQSRQNAEPELNREDGSLRQALIEISPENGHVIATSLYQTLVRHSGALPKRQQAHENNRSRFRYRSRSDGSSDPFLGSNDEGNHRSCTIF